MVQMQKNKTFCIRYICIIQCSKCTMMPFYYFCCNYSINVYFFNLFTIMFQEYCIQQDFHLQWHCDSLWPVKVFKNYSFILFSQSMSSFYHQQSILRMHNLFQAATLQKMPITGVQADKTGRMKKVIQSGTLTSKYLP